jgi:heterodisulfide reductase subunit C
MTVDPQKQSYAHLPSGEQEAGGTVAWNGSAFAEEVERRSGTSVRSCLQCHKCSTGCPIGPDMDLLSSQMMRLVQLGAEEEVLRSQAIWLCASCEACTTRCPMGIDVAATMDALRMLAVERKVSGGDGHGKHFNQSFLSSVRHHGRVFEVGMLAFYKLRSGDLFSDVDKVPQMLAKGKLAFLPHRSKNAKRVRELFRRAEEEEGKS